MRADKACTELSVLDSAGKFVEGQKEDFKSGKMPSARDDQLAYR